MSHGESEAQPGPGSSVITAKTPDVSEEAISDIPILTPEEEKHPDKTTQIAKLWDIINDHFKLLTFAGVCYTAVNKTTV